MATFRRPSATALTLRLARTQGALFCFVAYTKSERNGARGRTHALGCYGVVVRHGSWALVTMADEASASRALAAAKAQQLLAPGITTNSAGGKVTCNESHTSVFQEVFFVC